MLKKTLTYKILRCAQNDKDEILRCAQNDRDEILRCAQNDRDKIVNCAHKVKYKIIAMILVMILISMAYGATAAVNSVSLDELSRLDIVLVKGKAGITANGVAVPSLKPYISNNVLYIPMKAVMESMGADIETTADGTIMVTFRDTIAEIKSGSRNIVLNQEEIVLAAPPMLSGDTVMIPLDFVNICFDASTTYDVKTGKAIITLKEDGALSDLSFLTGSITTTKAGNSYFGWSVSLPRGSRVAIQSFNSKNIQFENQHYEMMLEVAVKLHDGKTLQEYYDKITEDPYSILSSELIDSHISLNTTPEYIELLYTDSYEEAVFERIYANNENFIHAIVTSYNEADPSRLKSNKAIKAMLDSFSLIYRGSETDTADFSKVDFGLAHYNNYISSETTGKKYLSWDMNVLPEWDLESGNLMPFNTQFVGNPGEYVRIELSKAEDKAKIETLGNNLASFYSRNFASKFYSLKSSGIKQTAGFKSYGLQFEVKFGSKLYMYDERLILINGIVYDITFRTLSESFDTVHEDFEKMLETFKPSAKDSDKILADLQKNDFNLNKNRVGKDDTAVAYENKVFNWKLMIPGYWQKNSTPGQSLESFYDKNSGAMIMVEAAVLKGNDIEKSNQERFLSMNLSYEMMEGPVKTYTEQYKNRTVTVYNYRIDNAQSETFADVNYYIFDDSGYRYCFMATIPDLTSSGFNISSLNDIWSSFEITK